MESKLVLVVVLAICECLLVLVVVIRAEKDLQFDSVPGHVGGEVGEALVAAVHGAAPAHALLRAARHQLQPQQSQDHQAPQEPCQSPHDGTSPHYKKWFRFTFPAQDTSVTVSHLKPNVANIPFLTAL